ncbi:MAG TPA: 50S ribosomal protein L18 [Actinomycetota bacterium]|jgi:large subunit ribosomal protein L18|nr:50S ribosomal protein L18 [Actinomycetota bacterium]
MAVKTTDKVEARRRRHRRVRKKVVGTSERPRLAVYRSNRHIYAQVIDDFEGRTLAAASDLADSAGAGDPIERARAAGRALAERARAAGIAQVTFDRGGFIYHGRVKALAEGAREGGLEF